MNSYGLMRRAMLCAGFTIACSAVHTSSLAQSNYPSKPVKFVVPFAAGGDSDILAREIASKLTQKFGYTVIVDNKPGAGGNLGAEAAMREPADGYTFLLTSGSYVSNAVVNKPNFDAIGAVQPVIEFARTPGVIVVGANSKAKTLQDLVNAAKKAPGTVTYGSAGVGSLSNLSVEFFASTAGIKLNHVPYKGAGGVISDVVSGQVEMMTAGVASMRPLAKAGKVRLLAVIDTKRLPDFPDVPTTAEAGFPAYDIELWHGLIAAKNVPAPVIAKINADINAVLKMSDVQQHLSLQGVTPVGGSPEQFAQVIRKDYERWQQIVKATGIKAE